MMSSSKIQSRAEVFYKVTQNQEVNHGSLYDRMLEGNPYSLTTSLMYILLSLDSGKSILIDMKQAVLVNRSIMTQMIFFLQNVVGNPITKAMVILYYVISNSCSKPEGFYYSTFTCWHIIHLATKISISFFMSFHQYCLFISWYIFMLPG